MKTGQGIIVVFLWGVARYLRSLFSGRSPRCVSGSYVIVLAQLLILLIPSAVYSQVNPPQLPAQAEPRRQVEPAEQLPGKPKPEPEIEEPEPVIQRVPFGADKVKIEKLNRIVIQGNTVYKADEFEPFYRDQLGKEVTLTDIYKIAERIQQKYRADDYRLTRVVVPEQAVKDGCIILRVVEGYIDDVRIEGNAAGLAPRIERYFDSGADSRQSLSSAGAGIRAEILKNLNIGLEVAQPLTREVATERDTDARAFLQVSARF